MRIWKTSKHLGLVSSLLLAAPSAMTAEMVGRKSIFSCKFGPECSRQNQDCSNYEIWMIVRHYETENRFALFDALNSHENDVAHSKTDDLLVFDSLEIGDGKNWFGSHERMVIAKTMEASLQGGGMWRIDDNPARYTSFNHNGACMVID